MFEWFADTSGWGNLFDANQPHHSQTTALYHEIRQQGIRLVTTNYVLTELVALCISPLRVPQPKMVRFIEGIKKSPNVEVVHINASLHEQAWQLLVTRPDKRWSLVDCASFILMEERGITKALTADHHFKQAGFVCLLQ